MRQLPAAIFYALPPDSRPAARRRRRRAPRLVGPALLVTLVALAAIPVAASDAEFKPRDARFIITFSATQTLTWKQDTVALACDGRATVGSKGKGRSEIRIQTTRPQPAKAMWIGKPWRSVYFAKSLLVKGTYSRTGRVVRSLLGGKTCSSRDQTPKPPRDCGTRRYPRVTTVNAEWVTPDHYPLSGPAPLVPSMYVTGPWPRPADGGNWIPFANCQSFDLNGALGIRGPNDPGADVGLAPLSVRDLFIGPRQIILRGGTTTRVDLARGAQARFYVSGTIPVNVRIRWTMRLTRVES